MRAGEEIQQVHLFYHTLQEFGRDTSFGAAAYKWRNDCAAAVANVPIRISFPWAIVPYVTVLSFYYHCPDVAAKLQSLRYLPGSEPEPDHTWY